METQEGKVEAFFKKAGKKIDELVVEIQSSDIAKKIDLEKRLNELKKDKERLNKQFKEFSKDNEKTFEDIRNSMEESIEDINKIFRKAKKA